MSRRIPDADRSRGTVTLPPVRRDRHGRGIRGSLAPPDSPLSLSRAQRFDEMVVDAVERLDRRWRDQLAKVEFAVEDIPLLDDWDREWIPLARAFAGTGALPPRIVVYRRPVETRATTRSQLPTVVNDVVVEQVAELLGVDPDDVDPDSGRR